MATEQYFTESPLPRRALRKGTRSCADCKRRKTRCFYDRPTDATCVACQRRGIPCFGQEFMDVPVVELGGEQTIVERLKRAELILGTISKDVFPGGQSRSSAPSSQVGRATDLGPWDVNDSGVNSLSGTDVADILGVPLPPPISDSAFVHPYPKYAGLCQTLHAHLPSQEDSTIVFGTGRSVIFVQAICNHYEKLFREGEAQPLSSLAALPAVTAHPIVIARKLLQLALCIQPMDPSFDQSCLQLEGSLKDAMNRYFNIACSLVTRTEELLDSAEGLECLIYESVFLVNSSNLRRALVSLRRAITLAQLMGLHRKNACKNLKHLDPDTHVSSEVVWVRIAFLERYCSLLLGMPTAISGTRFTSEEMPLRDSPTEWFEKKQIDLFGRMIERNQERNTGDLAATQEFDDELNKVANSVPTMWWAPLDLTQSLDNKALMERIISAHLQIVHYNFLAVLHLPYLLSNTNNNRFDYNKTTCIYASREVLNRFVTFRSVVKIVTCCRPVDFCAFTAALTLLIAYLNSHNQQSALMKQQRLGDRALIETVIQTMGLLNKINDDELSRKSAELARKLLDLEAECARGGRTYHSSVDAHLDDAVENEDHSFNLRIPYFGTVKLACGAPPVQVSGMASLSSMQYATWSNSTLSNSAFIQPVLAQNHYSELHSLSNDMQLFSETSSFSNYGQCQLDQELPDFMASAENWAFQGVDSAYFNSLMSGVPAQTTDDEPWRSYMLSL
ncbi:hypothetical protein BJX70DRAFT_395494 [Aspergillus crustosus]